MKEELKQIIQHYGIAHQLRKFNEECFELKEAITKYEAIEEWSSNGYFIDVVPDKKHIAEELADVTVMLKQFQYNYGIEDKEIEEVMKFKIERQLERINQKK